MVTHVITAPPGKWIVMIQVSDPGHIKDPSAKFSPCVSGTYPEGLATIRRLRRGSGNDVFVRWYMIGEDRKEYHHGNNRDTIGYGTPRPGGQTITTR